MLLNNSFQARLDSLGSYDVLVDKASNTTEVYKNIDLSVYKFLVVIIGNPSYDNLYCSVIYPVDYAVLISKVQCRTYAGKEIYLGLSNITLNGFNYRMSSDSNKGTILGIK